MCLGKVFHGGIDDVALWSQGADSAPKKKTASKNQQVSNKNQAPISKEEAALPNDDGKPMTETTGAVTDQMRNSNQRIRLSGNGESHGDFFREDVVRDEEVAGNRLAKDTEIRFNLGKFMQYAANDQPSANSR